MAFTNDISRFEFGFANRFESAMDSLRLFRARRAAYRQTHYELSILSERDLADLGISRADIPTLARQAAAMV